MGKVEVDERAIYAQVFEQTVDFLEEVGIEGRSFAKRLTPVRTGYAQRSVYFVVMDEDGNVLRGDVVDDNGVAIPNYLPGLANGHLRCFVGANADYYVWIEVGARGRPGKQVLLLTSELMSRRLQAWRLENIGRP